MILIDYTPFFYISVARRTVPGLVSGKFVQMRNDGELYLILSPKEFTKYHANILERFCMDKGIEGTYDQEGTKFLIADTAWEVLGGGKFEHDLGRRTIQLYDNSLAYGKFRSAGLKDALAGMPEFSGYTIVII